MKRRFRLTIGVMVLATCVVMPVGGAGASTVGANFRISAWSATDGEADQAIAYNSSADEYLVVWRDDRAFSWRGMDIYGQRLDFDGSRIGPDFRISGGSAVGHEMTPDVAYDSTTDQYLVVWEDGRNSSTRGDDIYGQRVDADGTLAGGNIRISGCSATGDDLSPSVDFNMATGQFLVVWTDERAVGTRGQDIFGQRVRAGGSMAGHNFRISGWSATTDEWNAVVAYNPSDDQFLVTWVDSRNYGTRGTDIYGQRLRAYGAMAGSNFRISGWSAVTDEYSPAVAFNSTAGQYLVVWNDNRNFNTRGQDIYGQRIKAKGAMAGVNFRVSGTYAKGDETFPAVAYTPASNGYLVVWEDGRYPPRGLDVYGQQVSATGTMSGGNFRLSGWSATTDEFYPDVVYGMGVNRFLVTWTDNRDSWARGFDIYGQWASA